MNNPRYRLLKNRYIAPTNNAGAPSPSSENSGTVWVAVVDVWFAVTTSIAGCAAVFATVFAAFGSGVAVAFVGRQSLQGL